MTMKILNHEGSADTFTFPHNPNVFDDNIEGNATFTNIGYQKRHIVVGGGGISPKSVILQGHFDGSSKNTNYQDLSKHFSQNEKLKRLHFEDDKFYLGTAMTAKKTHSGTRTNFIDYVANFTTILGILLDNTEDTTGTNDGNVRTFVTEITGTVTSGASDITFGDNHGNELTIPASVLTTGQAIVFKFVSMVDQGDEVFSSEYNVVTIAGTQTSSVGVTGGTGILVLNAGENVSTITTTNLTSAIVKYRDGWSA